MVQGSMQEDIIILNVSTYMKEKLMESGGERDKSTIIVEDFKHPSVEIERVLGLYKE